MQGQLEHYLLVPDETGLPALARWLGELPTRTAVTALIEVDDIDDEQDLEPKRPASSVGSIELEVNDWTMQFEA